MLNLPEEIFNIELEDNNELSLEDFKSVDNEKIHEIK